MYNQILNQKSKLDRSYAFSLDESDIDLVYDIDNDCYTFSFLNDSKIIKIEPSGDQIKTTILFDHHNGTVNSYSFNTSLDIYNSNYNINGDIDFTHKTTLISIKKHILSCLFSFLDEVDIKAIISDNFYEIEDLNGSSIHIKNIINLSLLNKNRNSKSFIVFIKLCDKLVKIYNYEVRLNNVFKIIEIDKDIPFYESFSYFKHSDSSFKLMKDIYSDVIIFSVITRGACYLVSLTHDKIIINNGTKKFVYEEKSIISKELISLSIANVIYRPKENFKELVKELLNIDKIESMTLNDFISIEMYLD